MKSIPSIASDGSPPERHADRVVDEMIRWLVKESARFRPPVAEALKTSADGNPKAQKRMAERIRNLGGGVFNGVWLNPGKRGRYMLTLAYWTGWHPEQDRPIEADDLLPTTKVWLAYWQTDLIGEGAGKRAERSMPRLLATHHALSRLAQRCDARTLVELINGLGLMWGAVLDLVNAHGDDGWLNPPSGQWRVEIKGGATVVLKPHERVRTLVAVTILDKDMT
jgi:hypothetical protein